MTAEPAAGDDAAGLDVLVEHRQLADRGRDHDLGRDADVGGLLHLPGQPVRAAVREADLLGPHADGDRAARAVRRGAQLRAVGEQDQTVAGDRPREQVRLAEEPGDERCPRPLVELRRRPELLDPPAVHHGDRVRHRHRLFLVVGDVDERDPDLVLDPLELELHLLAQLEVERAERLVEQEHPWVTDDRARERDPLLLAAGQLARLAGLPPGEADELEDLGHPRPHLRLRQLLPLETEGNVVRDRHVREERVALEDGVHVALVRREPDDVAVAEEDPAGRRVLEAADHPEGRRLAAAGRAEQREERAPWDLERDAVDRARLAELLDDFLEPHVRRHRAVAHRASSAAPSSPAPQS